MMGLVKIEEQVLTWWSEVEEPIDRLYNCLKCSAAGACRVAADEGRPLPCERFLEKEMLPKHVVVQLLGNDVRGGHDGK